jgi:hypothetical protein
MSMFSKRALARAAALTGAVAMIATAMPAELAFAQETPSVSLEQARKGEDGTTGTGADPGSMESGNAKRDEKGNAGNASAGGAGEVATADGSTGSTEGSAPPLPENAETLEALGILDDVTIYGLDVLSGLDIPVEVLPPPAEETAEPAAADDINTGGQGSDGTSDEAISTESGSESGPAGGSTSTAAEDGAGSTASGEKPRDRPRKNADGATDSATTGDGGSTTTGS